MKKITKNLCAWAMSLLAVGAMSSCTENGPVQTPVFPTVELDNQIWYDNTTTDIKSAAYEEEDGLYTFYLSPTEGLTTVQAILEADDYAAVQTNNPNGLQTAEDKYTFKYEGIYVSSTSMSSDIKECHLSVNFKDGTLYVNAQVAMKDDLKTMVKYEGTCVKAIFDPGLNNEIYYQAAKTAIKSALYYEEPAGTYTWYFSATEDITTIQQMLAADDYLKMVTAGTEAAAWTEVAYKDAALTAETEGIKENEFALNLTDGRVTLDMAVKYANGERLMAKYTGPCAEAIFLPELDNQCQNDRNVKAMGSIVVEHNFSTEKTTYYVYEETGVTAADESKTPVVVLTSPLNADLKTVDLSAAQDITLTVDGAVPATGSLKVEVIADKLGKVEGVKVLLEAEDVDGNLIRANYEGDFVVTAASDAENNITATIAEQTTTLPLAKVFMQAGTGNYKVVCGTNAEATTPEELMVEGHYAAELTISADAVKEDCKVTTINLASTSECGFKVYDYTKYGKWDNSHQYDGTLAEMNDVKSGTVRIAKYGDTIFWDLEADLGGNEQTPGPMALSSDWFGTATFAEIPDMTPVAPITDMFQILNEDGVSVYNSYYRDITSVQVAKVESETASGSTYAADYYYFYLVNKDTETNGINSRNGTPRIRIRKEYLGTEIDIPTEATALLAIEEKGYPSYGQTDEQLADIATACTTSWEVYYSNYGFTSSKFGNPAPKSISSAWPAVGTVKVDFDETTKKATIILKVQNVTYYTDYSTGKHALGKNYSDNKRWFEVTFDGTCVKYEGASGSTGFSASSSVDSMVWE